MIDDAKAADVLFSDTIIKQAVESRDAELFEATGATAAQREQIHNTFTELVKAGLPANLIAKVAEASLDAEIAAARAVDPEAHAAATEKATEASNREVRASLQMRYGAKEAERLLARADAFVKQNATLSKILGSHGLGSRPDLVEMVVDHVRKSGFGVRR